MPVVVVTAAAPLVSLAEIKAHLRIADDSQDDLLTLYGAAAQGEVDAPRFPLGRVIGQQTLELQGDDGCDPQGWIRLPLAPVVSISSVTYGDDIVLDPSSYVFGPGNVVRPVFGMSWPWTFDDRSRVRVRYVAGEAAVPANVKAALLLMVQDLYALGSRDPALTTDTVYGVGSQQYAPSPAPVLSQAAERLLRPYRVWSL